MDVAVRHNGLEVLASHGAQAQKDSIKAGMHLFLITENGQSGTNIKSNQGRKKELMAGLPSRISLHTIRGELFLQISSPEPDAPKCCSCVTGDLRSSLEKIRGSLGGGNSMGSAHGNSRQDPSQYPQRKVDFAERGGGRKHTAPTRHFFQPWPGDC